MLTDVLRDASERLARNKAAQTRIRDADQFQSNLGRVVQESDVIETMLTVASAAEQIGLKVLNLEQTTHNDLIVTLKSTLEETQDGFLDIQIVRSLSQIVRVIKASLNQNWSRVVSSESSQIALSLDTFQHFVANPSEAKFLKDTILSGMHTIPESPVGVQKYVELLKRGREIVNEVGDDPDIHSFIKKVLVNQANMSDITPKVSKWITEQNLNHRIRVSFI